MVLYPLCTHTYSARLLTAPPATSSLHPQLQQHLGDFPARLAQRWSLTWDYAPLPPVAYPELSGEMFCHRYYLRNLCSGSNYSSWRVQDHVQLLQVSGTWSGKAADATPLWCGKE